MEEQLYHDKRGILTKKGQKYSLLSNKKVDIYSNEQGDEYELDGTEIPYYIKKETDIENEKNKMSAINDEWKKIEEEEISKIEEKDKEDQKMALKEARHKEVVEAIDNVQKPIVEAIKAIPEPIQTKEVAITNAKDINKDVLAEIRTSTLDIVDSIEKIALDNSDVVEAISKIKLEIPKAEKQQFIDYTKQLKEISDKLNFSIDFSPLLLAISAIPQFQIPEELISNNRIKVEVDRISMPNGGGMLSTQQEEYLKTIAESSGGGGIPANKATDAYAYQASSTNGGYDYYFYEDGAGNWYILRQYSDGVVSYAKGTGGYTSVYVNSTSAPSGTPVWGTYDEIFDNVGAGSLKFDGDGNLEVAVNKLKGANGNYLNIEANGSVPVTIQDEYTDILNVYACQTINDITFASNSTIDTYTITLSPGHGVVTGDYICMKEGVHFLQAEVLSVATNTITLDRPLDYAFTTSCSATRSTNSLNVDGSVTRQIFRVTPVGLDVDFDITEIRFSIEDNVAMDTGTFGGIPKLLRGVVLRRKDGTYKTIFNAKDNGDFDHHCTSIEFLTKAPSGQYGFIAIYNLLKDHERTIRLSHSAGDELQIIVQDDLTELSDFHVIIKGHVVE